MSNPNKTVAAARRKMGGFASRNSRPHSEFMLWVFEQANSGRVFGSMDEAKSEFEFDDGKFSASHDK